MTSRGRRLEDTADGCRSMSDNDHARAEAMLNPRMRDSLERSAQAWSARAKLLDRLEASFHARADAHRSSVVHH